MSPVLSQKRRAMSAAGIDGRKSRCSSPTSSAFFILVRLRLRGPSGARDEFLLAATAQNLRKLAKLRPLKPSEACCRAAA